MRASPWILGMLLVAFGAPAKADPLLLENAPEVVFSQPIMDKVEELESDPVRIYEFVRNDLEYQVYWGLMKGPEGALLSGGGNDYDLSSLLISMLRHAGFKARFARGRIVIPGPDAVGMTGAAEVDESDPEMPKLTALGSQKYWAMVEPDEWHISALGGDLSRGVSFNDQGDTDPSNDIVERWHVWVEAELPLADYRGVGAAGGGLAWLPLDPASKVMVFQPGIALPFGTDIDFDYMGENGLYRRVDERNVVEILEDQIQEWLAANQPGAVLADVTVRGPPQRLEPGVLPTALPYPVLGGVTIPGANRRGAALADVHAPDEAWVYEFGFFLCSTTLTTAECRDKGWAEIDGTPDAGVTLSWADSAANVEGRRIALSFPPQTLANVLPDGYSADDCHSETTVATLSMDGVALPTANPTYSLCSDILAVVSARLPKQIASLPYVDSGHRITAGGTAVLHLDVHGAGPPRTRTASDTLVSLEESLPVLYDGDHPYVDRNGNEAFDSGSENRLGADFDAQEKLIGGLLKLASVRWAERLNDAHGKLAGYHQRPMVRMPATGLVTSQFQVEHILDAPVAARSSGLLLDVKGAPIINLVFSGDPAPAPIDHFSRLLGHAGSEAEHRIWEELAGVEAVSTVRGMHLLTAAGQDIKSIRSRAEAEEIGTCRLDAWTPSRSYHFVPFQTLAALPSDTQDGDCNGLDLISYCEMKNRFGTDPGRAWRAAFWDTLCVTPPSGVTTRELRIAPFARFQYRSWDGHVYYAETQIGTEQFGVEYSIQPFGQPSAGGAWVQDDPLFGPDPFDLGFLTEDPFQFFTNPGDTFIDLLGGIGDDNIILNADLASAGLLYDLDVSLLTSNAPITFDENALCCDPVSVVNGNFHHVVTDLEIPGRAGFAFRLRRSYNSRLDYVGPLGHGWTHTFDQHLRVEEGDVANPDDNRVVHLDEEGGETIFFDKPDGFLTEPWVRNRLVRETDGSYTLTRKDGIVFRFLAETNGKARLDRVIDRNGNEIVAVYDDPTHPERLTKVRDSAWDPASAPGREVVFRYDAAGNLHEVEDWTARIVRYEVNATGDLRRHWDPVQTANAGRPTEYVYYENQASAKLDHNLKTLIQPADRDGDGNGDWTMEFVYWPNDMVRHHTNALGERTYMDYNFIQKRTRITHPDGGVDVYVFNRHGRVVRRVSPKGIVRRFEYDDETFEPSKSVDGLGHVTEARYDHRGNPTWRKDRQGNVETFLYNEFSQPTRQVDRRGAERRREYDGAGNLLREWVEVDGNLELVRSHEYDVWGNRVRTCEYAEPGGGAPACATAETDALGVGVVRRVDALGNATRFTLDALGRPTETRVRRTRADGKTEVVRTTTAYDELGRIERVTDPSGLAQETDYDANGLVFQRRSIATLPDGSLDSRVDEGLAYDAADRLVARYDAIAMALSDPEERAERSTILTYDERGRLLSETTPGGRTSRSEYDLDGNRLRAIDPSGAATVFVYDAEGRVVRETDPLGLSREYDYDREGRTVAVRESYVDPSVNPPMVVVPISTIVYDPEGNPIQTTDAEGHKATVVYDELGRRREVTVDVGVDTGTGFETATTTFRYDLLGRLVEQTDAEGHTSRVRYDLLGRVIESIDPLLRSTRTEYDEVGNVTRTIAPNFDTVQYEYDSRGLLLRRHTIVSGQGMVPIDDRYAYDARGRQVLADNAALSLRVTYDALDRPLTVFNTEMGTARRVYDEDGFISQVVYPDDPAFGFPDGIVVNYLHDVRGQLVAVVDPAVGIWTFSYDAGGRLVRRVDPSGLEQWIAYTERHFVETMQLVAESGTAAFEVVTYSDYDHLGNPGTVATVEGATQISYDAQSQVRSVDYPSGEREEFGYDKLGNRVRHLPRDGIERTYVLDAANQLNEVRVTSPSLGETALDVYAHDDAGRRRSHQRNAIPDLGFSGAFEFYLYDSMGRLSIAQTTEEAFDLSYDATGHRFLRLSGPNTTALTEETKYFGEWVENRGGQNFRLVHGGGIDRVLAEVTPTGSRRTFFPDGSNNITHVAVDGALEDPRRYEAFGEVRTGTSVVERGFAGRPTEGDSSLIYLRARHYDPATGRFLQTDPLGLEADQLYAYAANNPFVLSDPFGLDPEGSGLSVSEGVRAFGEGLLPSAAVGAAATAFCGTGVGTAICIGAATLGAAAYVYDRGASGIAADVRSIWQGVRSFASDGLTRDNLRSAGAAVGGLAGGLAGAGLRNVATGLAGRVGGGLRVASSGVDVAPASIVRTIKHGEKVSSLIDEGKALTFRTGNEHALVSLRNGDRVLVSGGRGGIDLSNLSVRRILGHTHPFEAIPSGPSAADRAALRALGQRSSYLFERGRQIRFSARD